MISEAQSVEAHGCRLYMGEHASEARSDKRAFDVTASLLLLLFLLPVLLALVLLQIASHPRAPVFFRQARIGRGGIPFGCLKFRTMCPDADRVLQEVLARDPAARAEWEATHKLTRDPRISGLGAVLRETSLDELPQLLNVLRGEMSLVGPRPVTQAEIERWYEPLGGAPAYCSVRPGITGLWQVSGRSGTTYERRVALDCQYVREMSVGNDCRILVRTVGAVLRQTGAC